MTKAGKLAHYDQLKRDHDKLHTALYDLTCATKFPFQHKVTVNGAREIDETFRCIFRVSRSDRAMPVYMVECMDIDSDARKVSHVEFWTEGELDDNQGNNDTFFRMMRHARWKIERSISHPAHLEVTA